MESRTNSCLSKRFSHLSCWLLQLFQSYLVHLGVFPVITPHSHICQIIDWSVLICWKIRVLFNNLTPSKLFKIWSILSSFCCAPWSSHVLVFMLWCFPNELRDFYAAASLIQGLNYTLLNFEIYFGVWEWSDLSSTAKLISSVSCIDVCGRNEADWEKLQGDVNTFGPAHALCGYSTWCSTNMHSNRYKYM